MTAFFRLALIIFSLLQLAGCLVYRHNNLQEGIASFCNQDYRQAFIRLLPVANQGQPEAMYAVGYMYYYGEGVTEDRKKACVWINRAAKTGNPMALAAVKIISATNHTIMDKEPLQTFKPINNDPIFRKSGVPQVP